MVLSDGSRAGRDKAERGKRKNMGVAGRIEKQKEWGSVSSEEGVLGGGGGNRPQSSEVVQIGIGVLKRLETETPEDDVGGKTREAHQH